MRVVRHIHDYELRHFAKLLMMSPIYSCCSSSQVESRLIDGLVALLLEILITENR